ncbi:MAG TPA: hypothetical protein PKZ41_03045, partial [Candidatus Omnitrophota bacterium]|nr:hypothetical protein [Candidatus Omnitrophota bacterium]
MVQRKPITSEKQLLSLIENPEGPNELKMRARAVRRGSSPLFSAAVLRERFFFLTENLKKVLSPAGLKRLAEKNLINRVLFFGALLAASYAIADFSYLLNYSDRMEDLEARRYEKSGFDFSAKPFSDDKGEEYYLKKTAERNIFRMGYKAPEPEPEVPVERETRYSPVPAITEMTQDLRLVGISWSERPDALIEDSKAFRTFFVREGQMIGEVKVEQILKDRVVLRYGE